MRLQAPEKVQKLQQTLHAKAKESPDCRFYALYDKLYREDILAHAYQVAGHNGGKPGVDGDDRRGGWRRTTRAKDSKSGIPQGAPISPLLSNLYMRRFLQSGAGQQGLPCGGLSCDPTAAPVVMREAQTAGSGYGTLP